MENVIRVQQINSVQVVMQQQVLVIHLVTMDIILKEQCANPVLEKQIVLLVQRHQMHVQTV